MIFPSKFNLRKTNPLIYVKFWRQACLPTLLFGAELFKLSRLNSIEAEIDLKKLMFLRRLITEPKIAPAVRCLFSSRLDSFYNANITSRGVLATICDSLHKENLFHYLELWFRESIFPTHSNWKTIVKTKILEKEADDWFCFCSDHPSMRVARTCLDNISSYQFWSIADRSGPCKSSPCADKTHGKLWIERRCSLACKY